MHADGSETLWMSQLFINYASQPHLHTVQRHVHQSTQISEMLVWWCVCVCGWLWVCGCVLCGWCESVCLCVWLLTLCYREGGEGGREEEKERWGERRECISAYVCVCVCVCERERKDSVCVCVCVCVCVLDHNHHTHTQT